MTDFLIFYPSYMYVFNNSSDPNGHVLYCRSLSSFVVGAVICRCPYHSFLKKKPGIDFTKIRKSKINRKCYRNCDFQAFDWLKFALTTDLRLTTFSEIDHWPIGNKFHRKFSIDGPVSSTKFKLTFFLSAMHNINTRS
jgi:hypothetical protein